MARYSSSYSTFSLGIVEVNSLRRIAAIKERKDPIRLRHEINAICRGAIVLLSAHLEAYIKDLGEATLEAVQQQGVQRTSLNGAIFYHISKDLIDEISKTQEPCKIADKVFDFLSKDLPFWSRTGTFQQIIPAERFNRGFSNPAFDKIQAYFNRFGYRKYKYDLKCRLKADFHTTKNMVDHLVDTRNRIAHGDSLVTKTPRELTDMIALIRSYGVATDAVFVTWCKKNLCKIK